MEGNVSSPKSELTDVCGRINNGQENEDTAASMVQVDLSMSLSTSEKAQASTSSQKTLRAMDVHCSEQQPLLARSSGSCRLHVNTEVLEENRQDAEDPQKSMITLLASGELTQECPICMEGYDTSAHRPSRLHCNHFICDSCVSSIMTAAHRGSIGCISCPMCRQQTPMMRFEVLRMQEQMMENLAQCHQVFPTDPEEVVRRPGLCGALESLFQSRFQNNPRFLFPPCFRYSPDFIEFTRRLKRRSQCAYQTLLCALLVVEFLSVFILFLPIAVLALLVLFLK